MTLEALVVLVDKYQSRGERPHARSMRYDRLGRHPRLHRFLEAGVVPETFEELLEFDDFDGFLDVYAPMECYVREPDDVALLARTAIPRLAEQKIAYAEIDFYIDGGQFVRFTPAEIGPVLDRVAAEAPMRIGWIAALGRELDPEVTERLVLELEEAEIESLAGITMGGPEKQYPHGRHAGAYRAAREAGLGLTVHAGEAAGAESVWSAINDLGVDRIGHGVRAIEDPGLVEYLAEHEIPLEVCPTSNVVTGVAPSLREHPIRRLYDAGIPVTLNSDDPSFFGSNLLDEYRNLHRVGWSEAELLRLVENGFRAAFLPQVEIEQYLGEVRTAWEGGQEG